MFFGNKTTTKDLSITVYADERKKLDERWDYMCLFFFPTDKIEEFCKLLAFAREKANNYSGEMKFAAINKKGKGEKFKVAKEWVNVVIEDGLQKKENIFFSILGIDRNNLDFSAFGKGNSNYGKYANVYNRFFRSVLVGGLKYFFSNAGNIIVDSIFHDTEGNLETHEYFSRHSIFKIGNVEKIYLSITMKYSLFRLIQSMKKQSLCIQK
jgi:hypothetical protein